MKFLVSVLALISLSATANVGDSIRHNFTFNGQSGFQEQTVIGINNQGQSFNVSYTISLAGSTATNIVIVPTADLFTKLKASQILTYCPQIGGVIENVLGHRTCKVTGDKLYELGLFSFVETMNADVIWIGNVPVNGIVKAVLSNGLIMTLGNYNWSR